MLRTRAKRLARAALGAPGVRHGLRWFLHQQRVPEAWRGYAHRKLAKRAQFGDRQFTYTTERGVALKLQHTGTSNYLYWLGEYEPETTTRFCRLAEQAQVILDIGAADGLYAILAAAANPRARILAFEPGEAAAQTARRNVELNGDVTANVEVHAIALGEHDDTTILYVAGESGGTSSLNPTFRGNRTEQRVIVRNGDAFLAEHGIARVELIKIDTETTEPAVLRGLIATLRRDKPDIVCEVLHGRSERELEDILAPLGYRFYWMTARGLVEHEHIAGDPTYAEPNYLFSARELAGSQLE
ncbi:MAG TPA: FkbM family methyltransferase [Kofleriaceae bacterium]